MDEKMEMHFKRILTARLQQILPGPRDGFLVRDAMSVRGPMDEADLACAGYEKEMAFRMRQHNNRALREIMKALERIRAGEFGYCEECGGKIGLERLKAHPTASVCIDCKRELEEAKRRTFAWKVSGSILLQTG
ncbi:MAG: TraR/DksA family transcriptional regulator [Syntrophobacteraceae bacterium]